MKQRTFYATLIFFLFFFNLGIFVISSAMFKETTDSAKDRSLAVHSFVASSLVKDFHAVANRGHAITESIHSLLEPYRYLSGDGRTYIGLYEDLHLVYSNKFANELPTEDLKSLKMGERHVSVERSGKNVAVLVHGKLPVPYDSYTLLYRYDITDTIASWNQLKNMLFLIGFVVSLLLAIGLLLILNKIFRPLHIISKVSRDIASGQYDTKLPVTGNDELAEMARNFNHMADEIQRQMYELKQVAAQKQQFVDNFAHELRTPLTAIYGYAEYMQKAVLSEDDRLAALEFIMSETKRLQKVAAQLLELANLNYHGIHFEKVKVSELFENVKKIMQGRTSDKNICMEFVSDIEMIVGDAPLLKSLLVNLINNAVSACGNDGRIIVRATLENGNKSISVQDNGKGISPEMLSQITEPFFRGDRARNRKDGGAGLGLSICKQIASSHQADLTFVSEPGKGTIAKVIFTT